MDRRVSEVHFGNGTGCVAPMHADNSSKAFERECQQIMHRMRLLFLHECERGNGTGERGSLGSPYPLVHVSLQPACLEFSTFYL